MPLSNYKSQLPAPATANRSNATRDLAVFAVASAAVSLGILALARAAHRADAHAADAAASPRRSHPPATEGTAPEPATLPPSVATGWRDVADDASASPTKTPSVMSPVNNTVARMGWERV